jgi:hypothetical protein
MEGGAIAGNTVGRDGGGVGVFNGGMFTMEGGAIYGNTAKWGVVCMLRKARLP